MFTFPQLLVKYFPKVIPKECDHLHVAKNILMLHSSVRYIDATFLLQVIGTMKLVVVV